LLPARVARYADRPRPRVAGVTTHFKEGADGKPTRVPGDFLL
jgi:hypothetical protein